MHAEARIIVFVSALLFDPLASASGASPDPPMIVTPYDQAVFVPSDPDNPGGTQIAVLKGDPAAGPSTMLMRMKKGASPPHVHSSDYQLVVIEGTMKHLAAEQEESEAKPLGPGSYWFQPGEQAHSDACLADECLMYIVWSGKRDGRLVEKGKL